MTYPNTGTQFDGGKSTAATNSGLSTQILIKVDKVYVGALQRLTVNQTRPLERVKEIGTDGVIEIVPNGPTTFELTASRIVFDQVRLPESFARAFRFINSQRIPFDIEVFDLSNVTPPGGVGDLNSTANVNTKATGIVTMKYVNCWFTSYSTPYQADTYLITEEATLWCETAHLVNAPGGIVGVRPIIQQTDNKNIERITNNGGRRGSMDVSGLLNSLKA